MATGFGALPIRHKNGSPYNGEANRYYVPSTDATALFIGDFVELAGDLDPTATVATVKAATAGNALLGVVVGVMAEPTNGLLLTHRAASTNAYVLVADDPDLIFKIQEDAVGGSVSAADIGLRKNADIIVAAGSAVTGMSGTMLDSSTAAATSANLKIVGVYNDPSNVAASTAVLEVMIFEHALTATDSQS